MNKRARGPAKFSRRAKVLTTACAVTSALGIWNAIGHVEAHRSVAQAASTSDQSQAVSMLSRQAADLSSSGGQVLVLPSGFTAADLAAALESGQPIELRLPPSSDAGLPSSLMPLPSSPRFSSRAPGFSGSSSAFAAPSVRRSRGS